MQNFIDNIVEMLKNDTSGQLKKSRSSTFGAAVCTNNIRMPAANNNDAHQKLELDMLKEIFSTPAAHSKELGYKQLLIVRTMIHLDNEIIQQHRCHVYTL